MECVRRTAGLTFSNVRNIEAGKYDVKIDVLAQIAKTHEDNVFAQVQRGNDSFEAAAIPINNVWHSPMVPPRWCEVGTLHLQKGQNQMRLTHVVPEAKIQAFLKMPLNLRCASTCLTQALSYKNFSFCSLFREKSYIRCKTSAEAPLPL